MNNIQLHSINESTLINSADTKSVRTSLFKIFIYLDDEQNPSSPTPARNQSQLQFGDCTPTPGNWEIRLNF